MKYIKPVKRPEPPIHPTPTKDELTALRESTQDDDRLQFIYAMARSSLNSECSDIPPWSVFMSKI